ncbi:MAG: hypothetical protein QOI66_3872 [Myxococcales bacterium]|jgi:hypothetical protein|nr:hypothetical protein [Myxococcales bacterium]
MPPSPAAVTWLARVRHDLVKRLLWPARDRRGLGGGVQSGELTAALIDDDGVSISAAALWAALRSDAPDDLAPGALDSFGVAVAAAVACAAADDLDGVLTLEAAFTALSAAAATMPEGRDR